MKYKCYYGIDVLMVSSIEEYTETESAERIITHIDYIKNYLTLKKKAPIKPLDSGH